MIVNRAVTINSVPSIGMLLGTSGTNNIPLINQINTIKEMNSHFFDSVNDVFKTGRDKFINNFIKPIKETSIMLKKVANRFQKHHENTIVPMTCKDDFERVPPIMMMPILMYKPVLNLHKQGRIFGFGYEYDNIKDNEDIYGRLINNGRVNDVSSAMDKNGYIEFINIHKSTDPDITFDEIDMIEETRRYLDSLLEDTQIDPTDYPNLRG